MPRLLEPPDAAVRSAIARLIGSLPFTVTRASSGTTTPVYRVRGRGENLYFRVAESPDDDLAPELRVHDLLQERGCLVPRVVAYSPMDPDIGRSVAVLGEIGGEPVSWQPTLDRSQLAAVLRAAGRDLAVINAIPVEGFGWIRRDLDTGHLRAVHLSYGDWLCADDEDGIEPCLDALADHMTNEERRAVRAIVSSLAGDIEVSPALVHGDFDVTHIFHDRGRYTGLIDFGEIRGAEPWFDLSLFWRLHGGYPTGQFMYEQVLAGYFAGRPTPEDSRIRSTALLIALRFASRRTVRQGHEWLRANPDLGGLTQVQALAAELAPQGAGLDLRPQCRLRGGGTAELATPALPRLEGRTEHRKAAREVRTN